MENPDCSVAASGRQQTLFTVETVCLCGAHRNGRFIVLRLEPDTSWLQRRHSSCAVQNFTNDVPSFLPEFRRCCRVRVAIINAISSMPCNLLSFRCKTSGEHLRRVFADGQARVKPGAEHPVPDGVTALGFSAFLSKERFPSHQLHEKPDE